MENYVVCMYLVVCDHLLDSLPPLVFQLMSLFFEVELQATAMTKKQYRGLQRGRERGEGEGGGGLL